MQTAAQNLVDAGSVMSQESTPREGVKPFRVVTLVPGAPIPCGGTHVQKSSEIGTLLIRSIKARGGAIRVGYMVS